MSIAQRKNGKPSKGYVRTSEIRAKISAAAKLRPPITEETRTKLSAAKLGNKNNLGHHHSPETKAHLRAVLSGRTRPECSGDKHPRWKGGRHTTPFGYIRALAKGHPNVDCQGRVREHRLVMEVHVGRILLPTEVVHHGPGGRGDNRIGNLMLFPNESAHQKWHEAHKPTAHKKGKRGQFTRTGEVDAHC